MVGFHESLSFTEISLEADLGSYTFNRLIIFSPDESGRASKSQSQVESSLAGAPLTSNFQLPHIRAAMVAFHILGIGKYEKIRNWLMFTPWRLPGFAERPDLDVERPCAAFLVNDVPYFIGRNSLPGPMKKSSEASGANVSGSTPSR